KRRPRASRFGLLGGVVFGVLGPVTVEGTTAIVGGTNASARSQPTGPSTQPSVERYASLSVNSRPSITVPIIGETAAQPIDPMTNHPSGVIGCTRVVVTGGLFGTVDCANAGTSTPTTIAVASNARFRNPRIVPLNPKSPRRYSTQPLVGHHSRMVHRLGVCAPLMWPRNHRIDQLAALGKLMQRGMELT